MQGLHRNTRTTATLSLGLQLLADARVVFRGEERMLSEDLVAALIAAPESLWSERGRYAIDVRRLARELQPYGVRTRDMRTDTGRGKGYQVSGETGLAQAWDRWLPHRGVDDDGQLVADVTDDTVRTAAGDAAVTPEKVPDQPGRGGVADVADVTDPTAMSNGTATGRPKAANNAATPVPAAIGSRPPSSSTLPRIPGDLTASSPGQTDRVEKAVTSARRNAEVMTDKPGKGHGTAEPVV